MANASKVAAIVNSAGRATRAKSPTPPTKCARRDWSNALDTAAATFRAFAIAIAVGPATIVKSVSSAQFRHPPPGPVNLRAMIFLVKVGANNKIFLRKYSNFYNAFFVQNLP